MGAEPGQGSSAPRWLERCRQARAYFSVDNVEYRNQNVVDGAAHFLRLGNVKGQHAHDAGKAERGRRRQHRRGPKMSLPIRCDVPLH